MAEVVGILQEAEAVQDGGTGNGDSSHAEAGAVATTATLHVAAAVRAEPLPVEVHASVESKVSVEEEDFAVGGQRADRQERSDDEGQHLRSASSPSDRNLFGNGMAEVERIVASAGTGRETRALREARARLAEAERARDALDREAAEWDQAQRTVLEARAEVEDASVRPSELHSMIAVLQTQMARHERLQVHALLATQPTAIRRAGYTAQWMRDHGFTTAEVMAVAFPLEEMTAMGFSDQDLVRAKYPVRGFVEGGRHLRDLVACGIRLDELQEASVPASVMMSHLGMGLQQLKSAGYTPAEIAKTHAFPVAELRFRGGATAGDLAEAGYTASNLREAQFTTLEIILLSGYSAAHLTRHHIENVWDGTSSPRKGDFGHISLENGAEGSWRVAQAVSAGGFADLSGFYGTWQLMNNSLSKHGARYSCSQHSMHDQLSGMHLCRPLQGLDPDLHGQAAAVSTPPMVDATPMPVPSAPADPSTSVSSVNEAAVAAADSSVADPAPSAPPAPP